jgi:murein DD-endopeptidase MepM/ murein hydrolase activator NlpD
VVLLVAALAASTVLAPVALAQSKEDVERANRERDAAYSRLVDVRAEVDAALSAYDDIRSQIFDVTYQLERLDARITRDETEANLLQESARQVVVRTYINRTPDAVELALRADSIQDLVARQSIIDRANTVNVRSLDRLRAVQRELDRLSGRFDEDRQALEGLQAEAQLALDAVNLVMERAQQEFDRQDAAAREARQLWEEELARRRRAEEARRRQEAANAAAGGGRIITGLVCPQQETMWFRNDWGNPRSGGRTHKGTDIFGPRGKQVYAVVGGSLRTRTGGLGGTALWLYGNDGHAYYYAHLTSWADGVRTGTRVSQGQVIGYVGNTGNARGGAHHTHFEIHPGGGAAINPYWTLAQICRR